MGTRGVKPSFSNDENLAWLPFDKRTCFVHEATSNRDTKKSKLASGTRRK
jgi:hypothetical protein